MTVLLFDIDGTLVRTGGAGKAAVEAALVEHFGLSVIRDEVSYSGRTDVAILGEILTLHGLDATTANIAAFADAYLERLPARLVELGGQLCPGIRELLPRLSHLPLGLLTGNTLRGARHKLEHFKLWEFFHFGGYGDHHTDRDDVARLALADARKHMPNLQAADIWVIGDTPLDVKCAKAIGARSLAVGTGWHPMEELHATGADLVLETLEDFSELPPEWFRTP